MLKRYLPVLRSFLPCILILSLICCWVSLGYAQYSSYDEPAPGAKDLFVRLLRGPMGTLVMIFCGLSGFALFYTNREGKAGERAPIGAVLLLIFAILLFILRVMMSSGMMGAKYLDYGP